MVQYSLHSIKKILSPRVDSSGCGNKTASEFKGSNRSITSRQGHAFATPTLWAWAEDGRRSSTARVDDVALKRKYDVVKEEPDCDDEGVGAAIKVKRSDEEDGGCGQCAGESKKSFKKSIMDRYERSVSKPKNNDRHFSKDISPGLMYNQPPLATPFPSYLQRSHLESSERAQRFFCSTPLVIPWIYSTVYGAQIPFNKLMFLPPVVSTAAPLARNSPSPPLPHSLDETKDIGITRTSLIPLPVVEAGEELNNSVSVSPNSRGLRDFEPPTPELSTEILSPSLTIYNESADSNNLKPPKLHRQKSSHNYLWQFLLELLSNRDYNPQLIHWVDRDQGIFKMNDTRAISQLWGSCKNRPSMNYETMGRALRYYYTKGILKRIPKKRLVYQFVHLPVSDTKTAPPLEAYDALR